MMQRRSALCVPTPPQVAANPNLKRRKFHRSARGAQQGVRGSASAPPRGSATARTNPLPLFSR